MGGGAAGNRYWRYDRDRRPGTARIASGRSRKEAGAGKIIVTGTRDDTLRLSLARELGADETIIVEDDDPVERVIEATDGKLADIVVDVSAFAARTDYPGH